MTDNLFGDRKEKNSLILQDGVDHCLCNDKAVWVHHAILSTNLSCKSRERWAQNCILIEKTTADKKQPLTDDVVPDLLSDGDRPHSVGRDEPGEDGHGVFLYTWKRNTQVIFTARSAASAENAKQFYRKRRKTVIEFSKNMSFTIRGQTSAAAFEQKR